MKWKHFLRTLIIGDKRIPSRKEYKYAMLRGQIALLIAFICFVYVVIDLFSTALSFIPWYLCAAAGAFFILILNRKGKYALASILMLVLGNLIVFIFAAVDQDQQSVFSFFFVTAVAAIVLFGSRLKIWGFLFAGLSCLLALIAFLTDFSILHPPPYTEQVQQINLITNFLLSLFATTFIIYFLISRNHESELTLLRSQSELSKTYEELRKSRARYRLALQGTRAGIYELDMINYTAFVSPQWKLLLGYKEDELDDITIEFLQSRVHPEDQTLSEKILMKGNENEKFFQDEFRLKTKNGHYKWFSISGVAKFEKDKPLLVVGSAIDINERKNAEQELLRKNIELAKTNKELDRFVYSASHDMRAPLSSLLGLIDVAEKSDDPADLPMCFSMMKKRIGTMEGFIREVTDYSRNTRLEITNSDIPLHDFFNQAFDNLEFSFPKGTLRFENKIAKGLTLYTDPNRIKVVVNNLLSNAIKYSDPLKSERVITCNAEIVSNKVCIEISDNGLGIEEEHVEKIFEMFYRASDQSEGSGLGLYIVSETLQRLKGTISCKSKIGEGTTFTICLPF